MKTDFHRRTDIPHKIWYPIQRLVYHPCFKHIFYTYMYVCQISRGKKFDHLKEGVKNVMYMCQSSWSCDIRTCMSHFQVVTPVCHFPSLDKQHFVFHYFTMHTLSKHQGSITGLPHISKDEIPWLFDEVPNFPDLKQNSLTFDLSGMTFPWPVAMYQVFQAHFKASKINPVEWSTSNTAFGHFEQSQDNIDHLKVEYANTGYCVSNILPGRHCSVSNILPGRHCRPSWHLFSNPSVFILWTVMECHNSNLKQYKRKYITL